MIALACTFIGCFHFAIPCAKIRHPTVTWPYLLGPLDFLCDFNKSNLKTISISSLLLISSLTHMLYSVYLWFILFLRLLPSHFILPNDIQLNYAPCSILTLTCNYHPLHSCCHSQSLILHQWVFQTFSIWNSMIWYVIHMYSIL